MRAIAVVCFAVFAAHASAQGVFGPHPHANVPVSYTLDIQGETFEVYAPWEGKARAAANVGNDGELFGFQLHRGWQGLGSPAADFHTHIDDAHVRVKLFSFRGPGFERLYAQTWVWNNGDDAFASHKDYSDLQIASPLTVGDVGLVRTGLWELHGVVGPRFDGATIFDKVVGGERFTVDVVDYGYAEWPDIEIGFRHAIPEPSTLALAAAALSVALRRKR